MLGKDLAILRRLLGDDGFFRPVLGWSRNRVGHAIVPNPFQDSGEGALGHIAAAVQIDQGPVCIKLALSPHLARARRDQARDLIAAMLHMHAK